MLRFTSLSLSLYLLLRCLLTRSDLLLVICCFSCFRSSTSFHESRLIQGFCPFSLTPCMLLAVSIYPLLMQSQMSSTSSYSSNTWNLFLSSTMKALLFSGCCSFVVSYFFRRTSLFCFCFFNFILNLLRMSSLSLLASAPLIARVSKTDVLCCLEMITWSIWFSVFPFGDIQKILCLCLWGNNVPVITRLLISQTANSLSPLSFLTPIPCFPITLSWPSLLLPNFALKSPITRGMSCVGMLFITPCNCSRNASFVSSALSLVGDQLCWSSKLWWKVLHTSVSDL